ncbi:MAG: hypothetical protein CL927_03010 [Deltaproteobacteria bacterium]|nr:hypothetical protein [Deltaproteobacteria bacterium]
MPITARSWRDGNMKPCGSGLIARLDAIRCPVVCGEVWCMVACSWRGSMSTEAKLPVAIPVAIVSAVTAVTACRNICLLAGTPVDTPDGAVPIERLQPGHSVWAWSVAEGRRVVRTVTELHIGAADAWLVWRIEGGVTLSLTGEHPVWAPASRSWRPAHSLAVGDVVWVVDSKGQGHPRTIESISKHQASNTPVFNLAVETDENYLAGGVLVHNKSPVWKDSGAWDSGITIEDNLPPTVAITTPAAGTLLPADAAIVVEATIDDAEDGPGGLSVACESSRDGVLAVADPAVDADGRWRGTVALSEGVHELSVTVTDSGGLRTSASVSVEVEAPGE